MFKDLCNQLCIRMRQMAHPRIVQAATWLAAKAGKRVVDADAVLLPEGCRAIPMQHYDVDPVVLLQLKDGNRAILHQKMKNWQRSNQQTGKHWFMKGDQWGTKSDPKHWHKEVFPFLNVRTVKAMIADLVEASLLVVDGDWCQPLKVEFSGVEQMTLDFGKDFQQPRKVFHSSIESTSNSGKAKVSKQTLKSAGARKDAVADFHIPEHREQIPEQAEARDGGRDGEDILARLPGQLVTEWTNSKLPLEKLVEQYGVERINATWPKAAGFDSQIAGLMTLLKKSPAPYPPIAPPPPSSDTTNPDHETESDAEATPDIDVDDWQEALQFVREQCAKPVFERSGAGVAPEQAEQWSTTYSLLEIQLDRGSFETFFRNNVTLTAVEGAVWQFKVSNVFVRDMLQHRLYRETRRVLSDVIGCDREAIELRFEVTEAVKS